MTNKQIAVKQLQAQIHKIVEVQATRRFGATFTKWRRDTEVVISQVFNKDKKHISDFVEIVYGNKDLPHVSDPIEEARLQRIYEEGLEHAKSIITSFMDEVERYWEEEGPILNSSHHLPPPEKVTIPWLFKHVPVRLWIAALGLLIAAFLAGVSSTRLTLVKEIFHLDKFPATIQGTVPNEK
jgi:uncharacterized protein YlbG (UPF0298 family)